MSHYHGARLTRRSLLVRSAAAATGLALLEAGTAAGARPLSERASAAWPQPARDLEATRYAPVSTGLYNGLL